MNVIQPDLFRHPSRMAIKFRERTFLLDHLWELQQARGFLNEADVFQTAATFGLSGTDVESVISFYHFFHRKPAGKFTIYLNNSILSCFSGFEQVKAAFEKETGAMAGGTDAGGMFGLYETSCIGLSDREPAALINFYPFTSLTPAKVKTIIKALKAGVSPAALADVIKEKLHYKPSEDKAILFREFEQGRALQKLQDLSPVQVIDILKASGLTGRGGAFFPVGLKRELCRKAKGNIKYIVCNADEGEPGTFKDRALLNLLPGLLIEGMIIAGYAVGAKEGVIYLRAEYFWLLPALQKTLQNYRKKGYLGKRLPELRNFRFDIRVQMGAGAYICGEETALLESLEGKRGEPRPKTVFPTDKGFRGKPTVVNNVETFCAASRIIELGVEKFTQLGTSTSTGTKLLSIAGDCQRPGLYEIEWGMRLSELLDLCGADNPRFIQMSGPSGELLSVAEKERVLAIEDIRCGGSVMVFNSQRDLFTILHNFSSFFTFESCGLCTPCRAGNPQLLHLIEKLQQGKAIPSDLANMLQWSEIIKHSSRCGLGQTAPNSLEQALQKFPQLFQEKLAKEQAFIPAFDLAKATQDYNRITHEK